jgi:hypothetical protein
VGTLAARARLRERTIRRLVASRPEGPDNFGIRCGGVCQLFGGFAHFSGLAAAIGCHQEGELVGGLYHHHSVVELERFRRREQRYCELCRARVSREDRPVWSHRRLCTDCIDAVARLAPGRTADELVHRLIRWRYRRLDRRDWPRWATEPPP